LIDVCYLLIFEGMKAGIQIL